MKLYSLPISPFAARCRMMIYAKDLPIEIVDPPGGVKSNDYSAINPLGKVPSLDTGEGVIPESETILEFLEDHFPEKPLRPEKPLHRSRARLLARIIDLYIMEPMVPLFTQLRAQKPDQELIGRQVAKIEHGLWWLDYYFGDKGYAVGDRLSTADCAAVPVLLFVQVFMPGFGLEQPLKMRDKLSAYWTSIQSDPHAARVIAEIREGLDRIQ